MYLLLRDTRGQNLLFFMNKKNRTRSLIECHVIAREIKAHTGLFAGGSGQYHDVVCRHSALGNISHYHLYCNALMKAIAWNIEKQFRYSENPVDSICNL